MQADFWHARWANNQIGFHLDEINPYLMRHLSRLRLQAGERILVPLCGKTLDLAWLAAQGLEVLGVELSEKAVSDFFEEHDLRPEIDQLGGFAATGSPASPCCRVISSPCRQSTWRSAGRSTTAPR